MSTSEEKLTAAIAAKVKDAIGRPRYVKTKRLRKKCNKQWLEGPCCSVIRQMPAYLAQLYALASLPCSEEGGTDEKSSKDRDKRI
jgi:hypothetical protein